MYLIFIINVFLLFYYALIYSIRATFVAKQLLFNYLPFTKVAKRSFFFTLIFFYIHNTKKSANILKLFFFCSMTFLWNVTLFTFYLLERFQTVMNPVNRNSYREVFSDILLFTLVENTAELWVMVKHLVKHLERLHSEQYAVFQQWALCTLWRPCTVLAKASMTFKHH